MTLAAISSRCSSSHRWVIGEPPIVMTVATDQQGVDALWEAVNEHRSHLQASGELASRQVFAYEGIAGNRPTKS